MTGEIAIRVEPPAQPGIHDLLRQADAVAEALYPGGQRRPITACSLAGPGTHVLVAREAGKAIGLCILFDRRDGDGRDGDGPDGDVLDGDRPGRTMELKRMIVDAQARGMGVGAALLRAAEAAAIDLGAQEILLEVGTRNTAAQALYRRAGYQPCAPFPPYRDLPISLFMHRRIA